MHPGQALLGRGHELPDRLAANRHVLEIPAKERALLDVEVHELVAGNQFIVFPGGGGRKSERDASLAQTAKSAEQLLEMAVPASAIGLRLEALDADTRHDVAQFGQPLDVLFGQGDARGVHLKPDVIVLFPQVEDSVIREGLAS